MAFCFRIKATYEVGDADEVLREDVERRGASLSVPVKLVAVGARCRPAAVLVEEFDDVRRAG